MNNSHRMLLQTFMSKGIMNEREVLIARKHCCEKYLDRTPDDEQGHLQEMISMINRNVDMFGMEIKKAPDELSGDIFYGLVNTTESSITLLASQYTACDLEFFKKLVEMIVLSKDASVGSIKAVAIADSVPKMSKSDAESLLFRLEEDKWIGKTEEGHVYLSCRAILELEQYIFDMFGEAAVRCYMCKSLCLQGQQCCNCDTRLHNHCANRYFSKNQGERKCPDCRRPWNRSSQSPQPSTSTAEAHPPSAQPSVPRLSSRKRKVNR